MSNLPTRREVMVRDGLRTVAFILSWIAVSFIAASEFGFRTLFCWLVFGGGTVWGLRLLLEHEGQVRRPSKYGAEASDLAVRLASAAENLLLPMSVVAVASAMFFGFVRLLQAIPGAVVLAVSWLGQITPTGWMISGTACFTAVAGGCFFFIRLRWRFAYGVLEALSGVLIAAHRVTLEPHVGIPNETGFYIAVLTAGIYLVVRGIDNVHYALTHDDPLVARLRKLAADLHVNSVRTERQ